MTITHATPTDLTTITALEAACFPPAEAATEEAFRARILAFPQHFWLLWDGETLVSMINGMTTDNSLLTDEMYEKPSMHDEAGAWQMIFGVATLPEYRGQGCAAKLMRRVISDAKQQGRRGLVLTCKDGLISFYEQFGYVSEGVSESVHGGAVWNDMRLTF